MKIKKLLVCALATIMLMSMSITAFGAELTTDEQSIITALTNAGVPATYVTKAQNYLAAVDVTAAQATAINTQITAAKATAGSATTLAALTTEQKNAIVADAAAAGKVIGVTVTFNATANTFSAVDAAGTDILASPSTGVIKVTGANMNTTIAIVAVLAMALVACGVVVGKKRFAENA